MQLVDIKKIGILGAGTLGLRVGLQSAISGYETIIYEINPTAIDSAKKWHEKILKQLIKAKSITQDSADKALNRLHFTNDINEVAQVDLISESVTEDLDIKLKVWKSMSTLAPKHTIFTTNTSYLLPSMMAEATGRPDKFCALHFHDVFYAKVVDVMPHPLTDPKIIPLLADFGRTLEQIPIVMERESPGYVFNFMLLAFLGAAGKLLSSGIATVEDIDRSWMGNFHMPMGPFAILDSIGLDTAWHVVSHKKDPASQKFAELLQTYIEQGKLGEKSGEGFYRYPKPAYKEPEFLKP